MRNAKTKAAFSFMVFAVFFVLFFAGLQIFWKNPASRVEQPGQPVPRGSVVSIVPAGPVEGGTPSPSPSLHHHAVIQTTPAYHASPKLSPSPSHAVTPSPTLTPTSTPTATPTGTPSATATPSLLPVQG